MWPPRLVRQRARRDVETEQEPPGRLDGETQTRRGNGAGERGGDHGLGPIVRGVPGVVPDGFDEDLVAVGQKGDSENPERESALPLLESGHGDTEPQFDFVDDNGGKLGPIHALRSHGSQSISARNSFAQLRLVDQAPVPNASRNGHSARPP